MIAQIQLELNLNDETSDALKVVVMEKKLFELSDIMGKVRRKLFCELGEVRKVCDQLRDENRKLRELVANMTGRKPEWVYLQDGFLCDLKEVS